jgi:hypothetical protein
MCKSSETGDRCQLPNRQRRKPSIVQDTGMVARIGEKRTKVVMSNQRKTSVRIKTLNPERGMIRRLDKTRSGWRGGWWPSSSRWHDFRGDTFPGRQPDAFINATKETFITDCHDAN